MNKTTKKRRPWVCETHGRQKGMILMPVYHENPELTSEIRKKRTVLRERYGGYMSLEDLTRELGFSSRKIAFANAEIMGIPWTQIGTSKKYETDIVAKRLVELRGMC